MGQPPWSLVMVLAASAIAGGDIRTIRQGSSHHLKERIETVIRTEREWRTLWRRIEPDAAVPSVDFTRDMVLVLCVGRDDPVTPIRKFVESGSEADDWKSSMKTLLRPKGKLPSTCPSPSITSLPPVGWQGTRLSSNPWI
jgi:hypothetical protein